MSNRLIILSLLLNLFAVSTTADPQTQATAVTVSLANPSFENGTSTPASWTPITTAPDQYLWDTAVFIAGQKSVSIFRTRYFYGRWESDPINVTTTGFSWYTLSGQVKTEDNNGEVYLAIAWYDAQDALLATSDSEMLPFGGTDWQRVPLKALAPEGASQLRVWCISNHNRGGAWFDDVSLTVTQLPRKSTRLGTTSKPSYSRFLIEYTSHPLSIEAHRRRVHKLMTQAKWTRESGYDDPDVRRSAAGLYAAAAAIARNDVVLKKVAVAAGVDFDVAKERFEKLIDRAWWHAVDEASHADDRETLRQYLQKIIARNRSPEMKQKAQDRLTDLNNQ